MASNKRANRIAPQHPRIPGRDRIRQEQEDIAFRCFSDPNTRWPRASAWSARFEGTSMGRPREPRPSHRESYRQGSAGGHPEQTRIAKHRGLPTQICSIAFECKPTKAAKAPLVLLLGVPWQPLAFPSPVEAISNSGSHWPNCCGDITAVAPSDQHLVISRAQWRESNASVAPSATQNRIGGPHAYRILAFPNGGAVLGNNSALTFSGVQPSSQIRGPGSDLEELRYRHRIAIEYAAPRSFLHPQANLFARAGNGSGKGLDMRKTSGEIVRQTGLVARIFHFRAMVRRDMAIQ